jgi:CdiI immunity protein
MSSHKSDVTRIDGAHFPALRAFLRGYFHEDLDAEYGSTEEAVRQFCEDADSGERQAVEAEWKRFLEQTHGQPLKTVNQLLTKNLGSSRTLASPEELLKISEAFRACRSSS